MNFHVVISFVYLRVVRHPKQHPTQIQVCMTLPTRPHAIFSTLQGTQNPDTKPTLQRAKNAIAQPTALRLTNIYQQQQYTSVTYHYCTSMPTHHPNDKILIISAVSMSKTSIANNPHAVRNLLRTIFVHKFGSC